MKKIIMQIVIHTVEAVMPGKSMKTPTADSMLG